MPFQNTLRYADCHPDRKHYARGLCRPCYDKTPERLDKIRANSARWASKNPQRGRHSWLKHYYGITVEDFNAMLERQDGKCAICKQSFMKPCVDHDHYTGKVRGLLCKNCNSGLGLFGDDPYVVRMAFDYLTLHKK